MKLKFSRLPILIVLTMAMLISALLFGFGGITASAETDARAGDSNSVDEVTVPATKVTVSGNNITLEIGKQRTIKYSLYPKKSDDYVIFKSLFPKVATVDQNGVITAVGPGQAIIHVNAGSGKRGKMIVNVPEPADDYIAAEIVLDDSYAHVRAGKTVKIGAHMWMDGAEAQFTYKSDNTSVAKVGSDGVVTGVSEGIAVITVSAGTETADFTVSVYEKRYRGIDVSRWQGDIDWAAVAADGIGFAIIRSSFGRQSGDPKFIDNVAGCEENGIPYGFYHYTYAETPSEAATEARFFMNQIAGLNPRFPVVLDIEEPFYQSMPKKQVMNIIDAFSAVVESYGYECTVYSNAHFLMNNVDLPVLQSKYPIWVASWGNEEKLNAFYDGEYIMWQYDNKGQVDGIDGEVDMNYYYD